MSGQSWKQAVEELAGPEPPLTVAYVFSGGNTSDATHTNPKKDRNPRGVFFERRLHGAYDGDNS